MEDKDTLESEKSGVAALCIPGKERVVFRPSERKSMLENKCVVAEVVSTSSSRLTETKLEGIINFQQWRKIVLLVLTGREQQNHLTGNRSASDTNWETVDARILGQMLNSLESQVADLVTHTDTVKELWDYLNVLYSGQNNLSRIYEVSQEFYRADRKGRPLTQFFADFKRKYEELNSLLPITSDVKKMQEQREQLAVMGFLGGLGPEYDAVRSQILGDKMTSLIETFARVLRVSREPAQDAFSTGDSLALAAQGNRRGGRGRSGGQSGGGGRGFGRGQPPSSSNTSSDTGGNTGFVRTCHYCGLPGHIQRFCYKLHGSPPQQSAASVANAVEFGTSSQSSEGEKVIRMTEEEFTRYYQFQISQLVSQSSSIATFVRTSHATCLSSASPLNH